MRGLGGGDFDLTYIPVFLGCEKRIHGIHQHHGKGGLLDTLDHVFFLEDLGKIPCFGWGPNAFGGFTAICRTKHDVVEKIGRIGLFEGALLHPLGAGLD